VVLNGKIDTQRLVLPRVEAIVVQKESNITALELERGGKAGKPTWKDTSFDRNSF
jgi:hypothetical protein